MSHMLRGGLEYEEVKACGAGQSEADEAAEAGWGQIQQGLGGPLKDFGPIL